MRMRHKYQRLCNMSESERVTLLISTYKEQNLPVTSSPGSVICCGAESLNAAGLITYFQYLFQVSHNFRQIVGYF